MALGDFRLVGSLHPRDWPRDRLRPVATAAPLPQPMLAKSGSIPARGSWAFEVKWDGFRAIVATDRGLRVLSLWVPETRAPLLRARARSERRSSWGRSSG
jgi:hypothetical protein